MLEELSDDCTFPYSLINLADTRVLTESEKLTAVFALSVMQVILEFFRESILLSL